MVLINPLDQSIAKIQHAYSGETDLSVFSDLLEQEKKGKKRKVLKRWLRAMIKSLEGPKPYLSQPFTKTTKDSITGIPIIG